MGFQYFGDLMTISRLSLLLASSQRYYNGDTILDAKERVVRTVGFRS